MGAVEHVVHHGASATRLEQSQVQDAERGRAHVHLRFVISGRPIIGALPRAGSVCGFTTPGAVLRQRSPRLGGVVRSRPVVAVEKRRRYAAGEIPKARAK
jgi:hypothetical protein